MSKNSYYISKDNTNGEVVYLEYNKDGYKVKPKVKKDDQIEVNKIVFVSPSLTEKLIKKKINTKISKLLLELNTTYDDEEDSGAARYKNMFLEAEKLYKNLMNIYSKYLGKTYVKLTIKKLELIINEYKNKLYMISERKQAELFMKMFSNMYNNSEEVNKSKRGR